MPKASPPIPIHTLEGRSNSSLEVKHFWDTREEAKDIGIHRDDHYIFLFQEKGSSLVSIDFKDFMVKGPTVICILPGQVHCGSSRKGTVGWFVAAATAQIHKNYRAVFEEVLLEQPVLSINKKETALVTAAVSLLHKYYHQQTDNPFYTDICRSATDNFTGLLAGLFSLQQEQQLHLNSSRPVTITRSFKRLLAANFKTMKSPAAYARELHISAAYLNEAVRAVTGFPVSYWIQQEVVLEAKRLLIFSDLSIKEIAGFLGYEDHAYFSRLFSKVATCAPVQFREANRK